VVKFRGLPLRSDSALFSEEPDETDPQATARDVTIARASFVAVHATFYIVSVWLISYATAKLGYDRTTILTATRL
jgi:hypothetical protein